MINKKCQKLEHQKAHESYVKNGKNSIRILQEKYGGGPLSKPGSLEKAKKTMLKRYGVTNPSQIPGSREKARKTTLRKYGVANFAQLPEEKVKSRRNFKKARRTMLKKYGVEYISQVPEFKRKAVVKAKKTCLKRYGVDNVRKIPEVAQKLAGNIYKMKDTLFKKYGQREPMHIPEIAKKARRVPGKHPNNLEKKAGVFFPPYIKFTGDGKFWLHWKSGSFKNPDFIVRPFRKWRKVVEIFGSYWHKPEDEENYIKKYQEINVICLVLWDYELEDFLKVSKKLNDFLQLPPLQRL